MNACATWAHASSASPRSPFTRNLGVVMIHPIPSGTRDVLPDETREVRAITDTLRRVFERHGYGEVYTPALEDESVLARADIAETQPAYRVFDDSREARGLRPALTVPTPPV